MKIELGELEAFLVDMDGVLYRDDRPLPAMREFIAFLQGRPHLFLTNNSSRTPNQYAEKLAGLGAQVPAERILTSALVTAAHLSRAASAQEKILMIGGPGLREALLEAGLALTDEPSEATAVVVGLDREVSYEKLARATLALQRGARFFGTNADRAFPAARGLEPGAGALLCAIEAASGVKPQVFGKPERPMFDQALGILGADPARTAMIGDRYDTDILGARRAGLVTIAVSTGVSDTAWLQRQDPPPDFVFPSLHELLQALASR